MAPKTPFVSPSLFHSNVSFRHVLEGHDLTAPLTFDHIRRQGPSRYTDGGPSGVRWSNPYSFHDGVVDPRRVDRVIDKGNPSFESNQDDQFKVYITATMYFSNSPSKPFQDQYPLFSIHVLYKSPSFIHQPLYK